MLERMLEERRSSWHFFMTIFLATFVPHKSLKWSVCFIQRGDWVKGFRILVNWLYKSHKEKYDIYIFCVLFLVLQFLHAMLRRASVCLVFFSRFSRLKLIIQLGSLRRSTFCILKCSFKVFTFLFNDKNICKTKIVNIW